MPPRSRFEPAARVTWMIVCLLWLALIWLWEPSYLTLTVDDSFYVFKTATNAAAGIGVTFDGVNETNGFHPLWLVVLVPLSQLAGAGIERIARLALSVDVGLLMAGVLWLSRVGPWASSSLLWVASTLFVSFYSAKVVVNGLESALQLFLLCACLAVAGRAGAAWTRGRAALVGALCGLVMLARLDAVFFGITLCCLPVLWPERTSPDSSGRERASRVLIALGAMALIASPYFLYNFVHFHHWMPVSGAIKAGAVHFHASPVRLGIPVASLLALVIILVRGRHSRGHGAARLAFPLISYVLMETAYNALVRGVVVPEIWYLAPHLLLSILLLSRVGSVAPERPRLRLALGAVAVVFVALSVGGWLVRLDPLSYSSYLAQRRAGEWIARNTPPGALIAGWDCGIAAAHSRRRFMNLDGLINSWEYKEHYLDGHREYEFITRRHPVDYVCQYVTLGRFDGRRVGTVDFTREGWNVVYEDHVVFRSILSPWRTRVDVQLILTPRHEGAPFVSVAERLVHAHSSGS